MVPNGEIYLQLFEDEVKHIETGNRWMGSLCCSAVGLALAEKKCKPAVSPAGAFRSAACSRA